MAGDITFGEYLEERSKSKKKRMKMKRKQKLKRKKKEFDFLIKMKKDRKVKKKLNGADEKLVNNFLEWNNSTIDNIDEIYDNDGVLNIVMEEGDEYVIYPSYDVAREQAIEYQKDLMDDVGFQHINDWTDFLDENKLADAYADDEYDYGHEEPDVWLNEEPEGEDGEWSDEQRDRAGEMARERVTEDPVQFIKDIYGDGEEFRDAVERYVDLDELAEYVIDEDGIGETVNTYDGSFYEMKNGAYVMRIG